jgi:alkaline phosphatase
MTSSNDNEVTDSAAAGTALATGHLTNNGVVGLTPDGKPVKNLMEYRERKR